MLPVVKRVQDDAKNADLIAYHVSPLTNHKAETEDTF